MCKNEFEDDTPLLVRTWWRVHELSLVPIGADQAAKFKNDSNEYKLLVSEIEKLRKEISDITTEKRKSLNYYEARMRILKHTI